MDRVHRIFLSARLTCTECRVALLNSPPLLYFFHGGFHAGGEHPVSLDNGASVQLMLVKAPSSLGVFVGGVNTACGVPWCAGHGVGLPGTTAASVWGLRPRRGVPVEFVSSYGSVGRGEGVQGSRWGFGFPRGRYGLPGGHDGMVMTARHAGAPRGSGGVVTAWSWVCAWVRVCPEAGDGLGLRAHSVERHGRSSKVRR